MHLHNNLCAVLPKNQFCKGVLTLLFDNIVTEVDGAIQIDDEMADEMLGGDNSKYFEEGSPNQYIYDVLETAWVMRQLANM